MGTSANSSGGGRGIFLSWTQGNARTADLAQRLDLDPVFVCVGTQRAATAPLRWIAQAFLSLPALFRRRIPVIVLMMPPYPALLLCRLVARVRRIPLVLDAHSAVFEDSRWQRFLPSTLKHFKNSALTIVTNQKHRELLESHAIVVAELHDPPAPLAPILTPNPNGHVLVPASWHLDEPIVEIAAAAASLPEIQFVFTGNPAPAMRAQIEPLPANITLSGFVSDEAYADLLSGASMVCCMTLNDNTMQRGGYEALAKGLPLVTSDFWLLREYFGDAAEYAEPNAASLASEITKVMADHATYSARMTARRTVIEAEYDSRVDPVRAAIAAG